MIGRIRSWIVAMGVTAVIGGAISAIGITTVASAAPPVTPEDCSVRLLTFPTWFRGMVDVKNGECVIKSPADMNTAGANEPDNGISNFVWHIVLNVIEIALQLVIYISIGFIMFGGFQFLTSAGDPSAAAKSRTTILNAVIGLAISIGAVAIVNLILGILG
jgi:hypothetical protein